MQLLCVTDRWQPEGGGRERYLAALVGWAEQHGWPCRIVCCSVRMQAGSGAPAEVKVFRGTTILAERRLSRYLHELRRSHPDRPILALRPQGEATHYQLHSGLYGEAYAAERASLRSPVRRALFWPALHCNPARSIRLTAERALLQPASTTQLMCFTRRLAEQLQLRHGVPERRIRVCRPGIDHGRFRALGRQKLGSLPAPERELRLLFVAHDMVLKGLGSAVVALGVLRRRGVNARLRVVGRGSSGYFRRLAAAHGVADAVDFAGPLPQSTLAATYQRSHVLVHPTHFDPFPLVVLEALAAGCAVVTTRACGVSELMVSGQDGYVIPTPEDVEALAGALMELTDRSRWSRMRDAGIELASGFHFADHAAEVIDWVQSSAGSPTGTVPGTPTLPHRDRSIL